MAESTATPLWKRGLVLGTRAGAVVALLSVVSLLPLHQASLLEHFRLQLLGGSALVALAAALLRQRGWFDVAALCALLDLLLVTPALAGAPRPAPADGVPVRVLVANVLTSNPDHAAVARAITELAPDIVALVETDARWERALAPALASYSGRLTVEHSGNFGLALYARGELKGRAEYLGSTLPTIVARIALASGAAPLSFVLTHPPPPISAAAAETQREQLAAVARRIRALDEPRILAGDFNATPWSSVFARLLRESGLVDSRAGFGVQATFPTEEAWLRIPIDHALVSPSIRVERRQVERAIGSDHLPVLLDLLVPRAVE